MSNEVELKLDIPKSHIRDFFKLDWFHSSPQVSHKTDRYLENIYFDTPSLELLKDKSALRIRKIADVYYQTLKTKGTSVGGLHQRGEWEHKIDRAPEDRLPRLKPELFPVDAWPQSMTVNNHLPVFETNFTRKCWIWRSFSGSVVEVVLDEGVVVSGEQSKPICEIELELLEGNASCLFDLAEAICKDVPVLISDVTKAQRGFDLYSPGGWVFERDSLTDGAPLCRLNAVLQYIMGSESLCSEVVEALLCLVQDGYLPTMDVIPWVLKLQSTSPDVIMRSQWLLRLARHAWLLSNKDK